MRRRCLRRHGGSGSWLRALPSRYPTTPPGAREYPRRSPPMLRQTSGDFPDLSGIEDDGDDRHPDSTGGPKRCVGHLAQSRNPGGRPWSRDSDRHSDHTSAPAHDCGGRGGSFQVPRAREEYRPRRSKCLPRGEMCMVNWAMKSRQEKCTSLPWKYHGPQASSCHAAAFQRRDPFIAGGIREPNRTVPRDRPTIFLRGRPLCRPPGLK